MAEVYMLKQPGGMLQPANQQDADTLAKVKNGNVVLVDFVQPRNAKYHRKFFAMLGFAFEYWTPEPVLLEGMTVEPEKNFDRFRKDVLILAGYRHAVVNIKNEVRYEADSISFASMDDLQFQDTYKAVFNVCWRMVLRHVQNMTQQIADNHINQMLSFD